MASTPRWKGSKLIVEQPTSPDYTEDASGEKMVRVFRGPYELLYSTRPRRGATMAGFANYLVESVNVKPLEAGKKGPGEMTVTLILDESAGGTESPTPKDITDEVEWIEVSKPMEQAKLYAAGGNKALSDDDLDKIAEWKAADTRAKRNSLYAALSDNAKHFVGKLKRGQDTYVLYAPVARRTFKSFLSFALANARPGKKKAPPTDFDRLPDGFEWLSTAARRVRQGGRGKWEFVMEWTGAEKVDEDFYPTS